MTQPALVAKMTCVVAWSLGMATLAQGKPFDGAGGAQLMAERPDLFVAPSDGLSMIQAAPSKCWNWKCNALFTPGPNRGSVQRYCKPECRRARESELRKAARLVTKKSYPSIPGTSGRGARNRCYEFTLEVEGLIAMTRMLIEHLGGRTVTGAPAPAKDEAELTDRFGQLVSADDKPGLLWEAWAAYKDLHELLGKARDALKTASRNETAQDSADATRAWFNRGEKRRDDLATYWDDVLGGAEDESQRGVRKALLEEHL